MFASCNYILSHNFKDLFFDLYQSFFFALIIINLIYL